jgi:hypothetical protein
MRLRLLRLLPVRLLLLLLRLLLLRRRLLRLACWQRLVDSGSVRPSLVSFAA